MTYDSLTCKGIDRALKRLEKITGKPLEKVVAQVLLEGGRLAVPAVRDEAPTEQPDGPAAAWGDSDGPGQLRKGVKARKGRSGPMVTVVGPTARAAPHRHLVTRGHEVYSHGEPTGVETDGNPFVMRGVDRVRDDVTRFVNDQIVQRTR